MRKPPPNFFTEQEIQEQNTQKAIFENFFPKKFSEIQHQKKFVGSWADLLSETLKKSKVNNFIEQFTQCAAFLNEELNIKERSHLAIFAWGYGDFELAISLIKNWNAEYIFNNTTLLHFDTQGPITLREFQFFLDELKMDPNFIDSKTGFSLLHIACMSGNLAIVIYLVQHKKAGLNPKDHRNNTPVMLAASDNHFEIVNFLRIKSADMTAENSNGETILHLAAGNISDIQSLEGLLKIPDLDINKEDNEGRTPLFFSLQNDVKITECLIAHDADPLHCNSFDLWNELSEGKEYFLMDLCLNYVEKNKSSLNSTLFLEAIQNIPEIFQLINEHEDLAKKFQSLREPEELELKKLGNFNH